MTRRAFTLIELLVVVAIIAILVSLLLPALGLAQQKSLRIRCAGNLKQMAFASQLYAPDHDGKLPENWPMNTGTNCWVPGNMMTPRDATNASLVRLSKLFPYAPNIGIYRCPADRSAVNGILRVRSYAMNGWMGSRYMEQISSSKRYRTFIREGELASAGPANLWTIMDEHALSLDDAFFLVTMDDSRPFASVPATAHDHGFMLSFADGHVEHYKFRDPESQRLGLADRQIGYRNADWQRLKQATTVQ